MLRTGIGALAAVVLSGFISNTLAQSDTPPSATIRVDVNKPGAAVPPSLYGVFIEDINHAVDGGLYAELVQNRSFEEGVLPPGMKLVTRQGRQRMEVANLPADVPADRRNLPWPWRENAYWDDNRALVGWSLDNRGDAKATMKLTEANPMNAASSRSLELSVDAAGATNNSRAALVNSGYWGISVVDRTPYQLRFFVRPGSFDGTVTAALESPDGKTYASHAFPPVKAGEAWQELSTSLTASGTDPQARLVLSFRGQGTLQVDFVSLFPPTYRNKPNGLRKDLAEYVAGLKPAFVRWPGGCYVEGWSHDSAPDFRRTLGKPEERPGLYNYWKYRSTDGFGYHEYLELCEDLKAEPVYAVFGGMTVHPDDNVPLEKLQPYIDNAIAAIEYARGPVTSKWGAERAKMGHPEPFKLNYIEIGNEHATPLYGEYYKRFREQIKAKYPDITVVMSMFWSGLNPEAIERAGDANIDMVDEHCYRDVHWARANFHYFDRYPRNKWPVFVGEYASQRGNGDWAGGMGDSVFLMMCERNGDLVKLACYAPLFRNVHDTSWPVNLIDFDSSRSYAHGSYYVQKAFVENRPDVNLPTSYEVQPKADAGKPLLAGKIGLGAWDTQVEYKELRVYDDKDQLIYSDDFADLAGWETPVNGKWNVENGTLKQTGHGETPAMILLKKLPELKTGRVTVKARRTGGREGFNLFFNASGIDRFLFCNYGADNNQFSAIHERGVPEDTVFRGGRSTPGALENDRWYDLAVTIKNTSAEMFLDGKRISSARVDPLPKFFTQAGLEKASNTVVVKATNYFATPLKARVTLDGVAAVISGGRVITVKGDSLTGDNDFATPTRIKPVETPLPDAAKDFTVELPPYSVNVIRIPVQP